MLSVVQGLGSMEDFINKVVPHEIRDESALKRANLPNHGMEDDMALVKLRQIMDKNIRAKNFIGQGFYGTVTPHVIQRNMIGEHSVMSSLFLHLTRIPGMVHSLHTVSI